MLNFCPLYISTAQNKKEGKGYGCKDTPHVLQGFPKSILIWKDFILKFLNTFIFTIDIGTIMCSFETILTAKQQLTYIQSFTLNTHLLSQKERAVTGECMNTVCVFQITDGNILCAVTLIKLLDPVSFQGKMQWEIHSSLKPSSKNDSKSVFFLRHWT